MFLKVSKTGTRPRGLQAAELTTGGPSPPLSHLPGQCRAEKERGVAKGLRTARRAAVSAPFCQPRDHKAKAKGTQDAE